MAEVSEAKTQLKQLRQALDERIMAKYTALSDDEIRSLLIDKKWFFGIHEGVDSRYESLTSEFVNRVTELVSRYEATLPQLARQSAELELRVLDHLREMGFAW